MWGEVVAAAAAAPCAGLRGCVWRWERESNLVLQPQKIAEVTVDNPEMLKDESTTFPRSRDRTENLTICTLLTSE